MHSDSLRRERPKSADLGIDIVIIVSEEPSLVSISPSELLIVVDSAVQGITEDPFLQGLVEGEGIGVLLHVLSILIRLFHIANIAVAAEGDIYFSIIQFPLMVCFEPGPGN